MRYGLCAAVLASVATVPVVWASVDKTVVLVVDGRSTSVHTTASSVSGVLQSAGYQVGPHDLLAPGVNVAVHDGARIVLRRGRLLRLNIDGTYRAVWTTATTVREAMVALGYPRTDSVSVSRSRRLALGPTDITVHTPQPVTVVHDGTRQSVTTTARTVGQLLADLAVRVGVNDRLSAAQRTALYAGQVVRLQRVGWRIVVRKLPVPFPTKKVKASHLAKGRTKIIAAGKEGTKLVTYSVKYVDHRVVGRATVRTATLDVPVPRVVKVGTKAPQPTITDVASPSPGSAQAIAKELLAQRGWGSADQFSCLVQMWDRESGWQVTAANPSGAYGIPQALPGSKMASAGADWQTSALTQIRWGLSYIAERYGTPCGAWAQWQANGGWY